ncbi:hypothetical protein [Amycolatopsis echigonensis]|uniref:Holin n=1 Tax=Amycolatopsis echigonensis TaxID=2576905 RepID=A0A8E2B7V5_9PSEU|nr:hypothetical protein [Amycolatopsis echigonensis]MBB2504331.1 hypothetical protein [Amycolatopsis echigonensis]
MSGQHAEPIGAPSFWQRLAALAGRYRKGLAAAWGYLTVPAVVGIVALAGVQIDGETAAWIIAVGSAVLGTGAVVKTKPNDPPPPATE